MRRTFALILTLILALPLVAAGEEECCSSRLHAPYWHRDAACRFGEAWLPADSEWYPRETREIPVSQAEAEGQKPCPGCATAFPPTFTGEFPAWTHDVAPWGDDKGEMTEADGWPRGVAELPVDILAAWGNPTERFRALFPETIDPATGESADPAWPEDYAGVFVNACGGFTFLLVDPTPRRVAEWREGLRGEFWVLAARYSRRQLRALDAAAVALMDEDNRRVQSGEARKYHVISVGTNDLYNAVEIGIERDHFDEGAAVVREALAQAGYDDPGMFRLCPEILAEVEDF